MTPFESGIAPKATVATIAATAIVPPMRTIRVRKRRMTLLQSKNRPFAGMGDHPKG
jgi:hypothetical protein